MFTTFVFKTPYFIQWHPADVVVLVCGEKGEIQVLDCIIDFPQVRLYLYSPSHLPQRTNN